ncbi:MAG: glycosyltransferase family 2 protein [Acidimicrobiales bacterium]
MTTVFLVIVIPFLNEQRYLSSMLESVAAQVRPPDHLVVVDDGSTDGSAHIAAEFARCRDYVTVLVRPPRPSQRDRLITAAEWQAFQWAVDQIGDGFDVVAKLDADLVLDANVFNEVEAHFTADQRLGIVGPHLAEIDAAGRRMRLRGRPEHVHGAAKFYRRACYRQIMPIPAVHGWDMIDEVKARSRGWGTARFGKPGGETLHCRPMGAQDGALRGFRRWGQGDYVSGTHALVVLVTAWHRLRDRPRVVGSINYLFGWAAAALRRVPRIEPDLRAFARQEQLSRIHLRLTNWVDIGRRTG